MLSLSGMLEVILEVSHSCEEKNNFSFDLLPPTKLINISFLGVLYSNVFYYESLSYWIDYFIFLSCDFLFLVLCLSLS